MSAAAAHPFDPKAFRGALGSFATGVTVITTRCADGSLVGLTANSFNSVSLDPPMVLWSLAKAALSLPAFRDSGHWAVHILAAGQQDLSQRFARSGADKFAGLEIENGVAGTPLLQGCATRLQCKSSFQYEGGDHLIFVGEVLDFDCTELPPLVFHGGRYAVAAPKTDRVSLARGETVNDAPWNEDHIGYLLGRAYFQVYARIREHAQKHGLSDAEYFALTTLLVQDGYTQNNIASLLACTGIDSTWSLLDGLRERGLVRAEAGTDSPRYRLSPRGRELALQVVAAAHAIDRELAGRLGGSEDPMLRNQLKRLIQLTDPGLPDLWA